MVANEVDTLAGGSQTRRTCRYGDAMTPGLPLGVNTRGLSDCSQMLSTLELPRHAAPKVGLRCPRCSGSILPSHPQDEQPSCLNCGFSPQDQAPCKDLKEPTGLIFCTKPAGHGGEYHSGSNNIWRKVICEVEL